GLVYGDQGLVVSRPMYDRVLGYPEWSLMEDVGIVRRLSQQGRRVALPATIVTSSRRYDQEGGLRRWMRNVMLMCAFRAGVHPDRLTRWYRTRRSRPATAQRRVVGVFARPPIPGRVKTRLAADIGEIRATEVYRVLGRRTVDALRDGESEVLVFVDVPPDRDPSGLSTLDSTSDVKEWLGDRGIDFRTQTDGDLGARMYAALEECLAGADAACLVGTDLPDLRDTTVEAAFSALSRAEVVVGPATDGGYYLIGMTVPHRELFVDIPWSTDKVLALTLERAAALGLRVELLEPKTDVDTAADLPADLAVGGRPPA
ncbi:MAG: TIGR04282 family arsenosugar biosynthesis glycosyltransferase, partial [Gemmatimonadota bacterium]|nr:TIGR04282 family arsenosugar biosynthesis glycosyltransferase [Gemmatimonadota bacterium]